MKQHTRQPRSKKKYRLFRASESMECGERGGVPVGSCCCCILTMIYTNPSNPIYIYLSLNKKRRKKTKP